MPKKRKHAWDIQQDAFTSLKDQFTVAAKKGEDNVSQLIAEFTRGQKDIRQNVSHLGSPLNNLRFLQRGADGEYQPYNFSSNTPYQMKVWDDYLEHIGRRHHGFGCIPANEREIEKLIKQNGPKKMEDRLRRYIKRRIQQAKKQCAQGGYLF